MMNYAALKMEKCCVTANVKGTVKRMYINIMLSAKFKTVLRYIQKLCVKKPSIVF